MRRRRRGLTFGGRRRGRRTGLLSGGARRRPRRWPAALALAVACGLASLLAIDLGGSAGDAPNALQGAAGSPG
ncbi:MAG: hypothetical protein ACR2NA_04170, partial [Solirubrobacterales bacterium]